MQSGAEAGRRLRSASGDHMDDQTVHTVIGHAEGFRERVLVRPALPTAAFHRTPTTMLVAGTSTTRRLIVATGVVWSGAVTWEVARHTVLAPLLSPGASFNITQTVVGAIVLGGIGTVLTLVFGRTVLAREATLLTSTQQLEAALQELQETNVAALSALADAIDARDPYTRRHSEHAAHLAERVARAMGLPAEEVEMTRLAAILHDIGKLAVPDKILCKEGPLTPDERRVVERHPDIGADIIEHIPFLRRVAGLVRHHQERWDGGGYPAGLQGRAIPLGSRIVAVVDAFNAMTTDRPYRKARTQAEAITELQRNAGSQFSPDVVDAFIANFDRR